MRKLRKIFLIALILALVLIPSALAATDHTVVGDLQAFVQGFRQAFHGDWNGLVEGLVQSFPLFGLLVVVFGLMYFIAVTTLFSDEKHHKFARMISAGIALLGLAQQSVYNWILGVSTAFVIVMFVLVVLGMLIMSLRQGRTKVALEGNKMFRAKKLELSAKHDLTQLKHDVRMDKAENKHVWNRLRSLEGDIHELSRLEGTILHQIDQLLQLVGKAYSAKVSGNSDELHGYAKSLSNGVHTLASTMRAQKSHMHKVADITRRLRDETAKWAAATQHEGQEDAHFEHIMKGIVRSGDLGHETRTIMREDGQIHYLLKQLSEYLRELKSLEAKMEALETRLEAHMTNKEAADVEKIQTEIAKFDFARAQQLLGNLRRLVEEDEVYIKELGAFDVEAKHLLKNISDAERSLEPKIRDVINRLDHAAAAHTTD